MSLNLPSNGIFTTIHDFLIDQISKPLGLGSYGTVRRALYKPTQALYAIKIISIDENISEVDILGLQRQIQIHRKLNHPHIVKLWDILSQNSKIYLIMEWAQNGTLFNFQNENPKLSESTIKKIYSQVLNAVDYIHNQDVIHRDIKPENILLDSKNNVKICDFGSAGYQITRLRNTFCGTYEYMAPQIILQQSYDYRVDIWALGVLLYQLVHNEAPFHAESLQQMKQCIVEGQYSINQKIVPSIKKLIITIMQFNAQNRPTIKQIIADQWFKTNEIHTIQKQQKMTKKIQHLSNQSLQKYSPINLKHRKHQSMDLDYFNQALTKKFFNNQKLFEHPTINKTKLKTQQNEVSGVSIQNWMKSSMRIRTKTQEQQNVPINTANLGARKKMKRRIDSSSKIVNSIINMNKIKVDQKKNIDRLKAKRRKDIKQYKKSTML